MSKTNEQRDAEIDDLIDGLSVVTSATGAYQVPDESTLADLRAIDGTSSTDDIRQWAVTLTRDLIRSNVITGRIG